MVVQPALDGVTETVEAAIRRLPAGTDVFGSRPADAFPQEGQRFGCGPAGVLRTAGKKAALPGFKVVVTAVEKPVRMVITEVVVPQLHPVLVPITGPKLERTGGGHRPVDRARGQAGVLLPESREERENAWPVFKGATVQERMHPCLVRGQGSKEVAVPGVVPHRPRSLLDTPGHEFTRPRRNPTDNRRNRSEQGQEDEPEERGSKSWHEAQHTMIPEIPGRTDEEAGIWPQMTQSHPLLAERRALYFSKT